MEEKELLEYARKYYPIGTQYVPAHVDKGINEVINIDYDYSKSSNEYIHVGSKHVELDYNNCIYADGKWATIHNEPIKQPEIIKHPEPINYEALQNKAFATLLPKEEIEPEKWVPKVGDWVVSLVDKGDYRNKGDVFQVLKADNDCLYYKKDVNGDIKTFRPAEPHEISGELIDLTYKEISGKLKLDLDFPKAFPLTPEQCIKPTIKSNTQEEIKIEIKKSKTIKI
jgi:hypothetical protein